MLNQLNYIVVSIFEPKCTVGDRMVLLQRKLYFSKDPEGVQHLPGGGDQLLPGGWGSKIVSEYDQEIPQSQTAENPVAPRGRAAQPSRDTRKTN